MKLTCDPQLNRIRWLTALFYWIFNTLRKLFFKEISSCYMEFWIINKIWRSTQVAEGSALEMRWAKWKLCS